MTARPSRASYSRFNLRRPRKKTERERMFEEKYELSNKLWHKLAVCPDKKFAIPIVMDKNTLIVPAHDALLKYDISQNKWNDFYKYPKEIRFNFGKHRIEYLHFNHKTNFLYILAIQKIAGSPDFIKINVKTNKFEKLSDLDIKQRSLNSKCIQIGDKLHLFIQNRYNYRLRHILYDKKKNIHTNIKQFKHFQRNECYLGIIHLKLQQKILLININQIHSYSIKEKEWKMLNIVFPEDLKEELIETRIDQFAHILSKNEEFLILFTGFIWLIDLKNNFIHKTKIVCPLVRGYFHCIMLNEDKNDDTICKGYIRQCWNDNQEINKTLQILPWYLIKLIQSYFSDQILHLFETYEKIGHWRIKMNDILKNV